MNKYQKHVACGRYGSNKKFLMPRKDDKDFDNFSRFWIYGNVYVVGQSKSRGRRYHITGINKCFVYRDCNVKV